MALEAKYVLGEELGGLQINGVYVRIRTLTVDITRNKYVNAELFYYASAELREQNKPFKQGVVIDIPNEWFEKTLFTKDNLHKKAYEYLKTLPEFENATDC